MRFPHAHLWKLSSDELAEKCREICHGSFSTVDPEHREEARRIYGSWTDALALNLHEQGAKERQAVLTQALRKRTIEIMVKAGLVEQ